MRSGYDAFGLSVRPAMSWSNGCGNAYLGFNDANKPANYGVVQVRHATHIAAYSLVCLSMGHDLTTLAHCRSGQVAARSPSHGLASPTLLAAITPVRGCGGVVVAHRHTHRHACLVNMSARLGTPVYAGGTLYPVFHFEATVGGGGTLDVSVGSSGTGAADDETPEEMWGIGTKVDEHTLVLSLRGSSAVLDVEMWWTMNINNDPTSEGMWSQPSSLILCTGAVPPCSYPLSPIVLFSHILPGLCLQARWLSPMAKPGPPISCNRTMDLAPFHQNAARGRMALRSAALTAPRASTTPARIRQA